MNSKGTTFKIVTTVLLVAAFAVIFVLFSKNQNLETKVNTLEQENVICDERVDELKEGKEGLKRDIDKKNVQIDHLEDQVTERENNIRSLEDEKRDLQVVNDTLNRRIAEVRNEMALMADIEDDEQIARIQAELQALQREKDQVTANLKARDSLINNYAKEVSQLSNQLSQFRQDSIELAFQIDSLYQEVADRDSVYVRYKSDMALVREIVENTRIKATRVKLSEKANGRGVVRNYKRPNQKDKWKYTTFKLSLHHPRPEVLIKEQLAVQIFDLDNDKPVELREGNRNYSDPFLEFPRLATKTDQEIELLHYNHDFKGGKNYEARFYLLLKGEAYMLGGREITLIENEKIRVN